MKKKRKRKRFLLLFLFLSLLYFFFYFFDQKLLPPLKEISHMQCKTTANQIIDHSASAVLKELDLSNIIISSPSSDGNSYSINAAVINEFCFRFSQKLTNELAHLSEERIYIPLGAATELHYFANKGPLIPYTLIPMGAAKVDYDSALLTAGINQINYKIWLNVSMEIKIVNPIYHEKISMERKIMLVDIVFSGKVPEHFFQFTPQGEYLLTE